MFPTEVDIESFSQQATQRWKRANLSLTDRSIAKSDTKKLHSLISTSNPKNFLNINTSTADDSVKVSNHEDLKEISLQLSILKKKHDLNRDSNVLHDTNIVKLKKQLESFKQEEDKTLNRLESLKREVARLEDSIQEILLKQENANSATKIYNHILERMKINKMKLDQQNETIIKAVKTNNKTLLDEIEISRKQKESKIKTKKALEIVKTFIDKETKEKSEMVEGIAVDVKKKQESTQKREESYKRQIEIAETAANEDREMRATQMREGVIVHKFWFLYMQKKLEYDIEKLCHIENAFEKVRKNSNINHASEMVTKFLTTEIDFNELRRIVEESNSNIVKTQTKIAEIEVSLSNLEKSQSRSEIKEALNSEVIAKLKIASENKTKMLRVKLVHDKIRSWTVKIMKKFEIKEKDQGLLEGIQTIREHIQGVMKSYKFGNDEKKNMTLKEIIDSIDVKQLKKPRGDSIDPEENPVVKDLGYNSPNLDSKLKKSY